MITSTVERIWDELKTKDYGGFFVTAEVSRAGNSYPQTLDAFILQKLSLIQQDHISGRRFVFREEEWKIYLTFFPRNEVVSEKYALKNKAFKQQTR